jgi:hypothetical protein
LHDASITRDNLDRLAFPIIAMRAQSRDVLLRQVHRIVEQAHNLNPLGHLAVDDEMTRSDDPANVTGYGVTARPQMHDPNAVSQIWSIMGRRSSGIVLDVLQRGIDEFRVSVTHRQTNVSSERSRIASISSIASGRPGE